MPSPTVLTTLTAPLITQSIALLTGARAFSMNPLTGFDGSPSPSKLARKPIATGIALARAFSTIPAATPMEPLAIAARESITALTSAMICVPRLTKNMTMS